MRFKNFLLIFSVHLVYSQKDVDGQMSDGEQQMGDGAVPMYGTGASPQANGGSGSYQMPGADSELTSGNQQMGAGIPPMEASIPQMGAGISEMGAGIPQMDPGSPQMNAGNPSMDAGNPQTNAGNPQMGIGNPQIGDGNPQMGAGNPQMGAGNPQMGAGDPQMGAGNQQMGAGNPQMGAGDPQMGAGNPQMGAGSPPMGGRRRRRPRGPSRRGKRGNSHTPIAFFKCRNNDASLCPVAEDIKFYLFTNYNTSFYELVPGYLEKMPYRKGCPFLFLTHGYLHDAFSTWISQMINALFTRGCYNIIVVDWSKISRKSTHPKRMADLMVANVTYKSCCAGGFVGEFISQLLKLNFVTPPSIHFVAHSIGAHLAGCAGQYVFANTRKKIGQITALDPSGGEFAVEGPDCKLTPDDSSYVDVIHTDSKLGHEDPIGHVDFYPNGGRSQPKCVWSIPTNTIDDKAMFWSHTIAIKLYIYSINNLGFLATECYSYYTYECKRCTGNPTTEMGYHVNMRSKGMFYLDTHNCPPYVKYGEIAGKFKCLKH